MRSWRRRVRRKKSGRRGRRMRMRIAVGGRAATTLRTLWRG
jgi:hypothetical protein